MKYNIDLIRKDEINQGLSVHSKRAVSDRVCLKNHKYGNICISVALIMKSPGPLLRDLFGTCWS